MDSPCESQYHAHNNIGKVYLAAWDFEYASKLMPHHPEPRNNLGLILENVYRYDDAIAHYEEALKVTPDDPEIIGNLVRARLRPGDAFADVKPLLEQLVMTEVRPEWKAWGEEQLSRAVQAEDENH